MASAMGLAQVPTPGTPTSTGAANAVKPLVDVLGAHNNYGRGCAGCHAPHSGNRGAGGNPITGATSDPWSGANALFAQDMGPLFATAAGYFDFSDISNTGSALKYVFVPPSNPNPTSWNIQQYNDVRRIVMCLACHDGAVAKGAMMANWAYEQQIKALPTSYGTAQIPTLLGDDGSSAGYHNDHPVGENATLSAVMHSTYGDASNGVVFVTNATSGKITSITAAGQYASFISSYGAPAIGSTIVNSAGVPYLVCTTCHNQHVMNVYAAGSGASGTSNITQIAGASTGTYATYFFVNGPYNINNVTVPPTQAASTTQFCRQCHFGESNEAAGGSLTTSF
jgi:hypothetical protein